MESFGLEGGSEVIWSISQTCSLLLLLRMGRGVLSRYPWDTLFLP